MVHLFCDDRSENEGEEDGWVDNGLKAAAPTYEELIEEIDRLLPGAQP